MNPQSEKPLSALPQEDIIFIIKRHPIGIIGVYASSSALLIALAIVAFGLAPKYITAFGSSEIYGIATVVYLLFLFVVLGFVFVSHMVYWDNSWTLSSESLAQVTRTGLFDKQSSHLSLGNLQDVTASQDGVLQHLFHYGSLRVESAGETSKFVFPYCPNPDTYAEYILEARERFEQGDRGNDGLQGSYSNRAKSYQAASETEAQPPTYPIPPSPPTAE